MKIDMVVQLPFLFPLERNKGSEALRGFQGDRSPARRGEPTKPSWPMCLFLILFFGSTVAWGEPPLFFEAQNMKDFLSHLAKDESRTEVKKSCAYEKNTGQFPFHCGRYFQILLENPDHQVLSRLWFSRITQLCISSVNSVSSIHKLEVFLKDVWVHKSCRLAIESRILDLSYQNSGSIGPEFVESSSYEKESLL